MKNCLGKYSKELRNQNEEYLINPFESNISESARTFESKNQTKINITCHRVMENGCILARISLMNTY